MRRLGKRLGVEAVSLYNHVDGKPALRAGIVRLLWRRLSIRSKTATAGSTLCAPSRDASATSRRSIRTRRSRRSPSRRPTAGEGADELESLVTFIRAFPPDTPPELVRVAGDTCMCDADDGVEYGLEALLAGLDPGCDTHGD